MTYKVTRLGTRGCRLVRLDESLQPTNDTVAFDVVGEDETSLMPGVEAHSTGGGNGTVTRVILDGELSVPDMERILSLLTDEHVSLCV